MTDDELVDAIAQRFGLAGVRDDDRGDMLDLGLQVGLEDVDDATREALADRLDELRCYHRRLTYHGQTLSPAEWARRIVAKITATRGRAEATRAVEAILTGERGGARGEG